MEVSEWRNEEVVLINKVLSTLSLIGCLFMVAFLLFHYPELPDSVPTHYGFNGRPDHFGGKSALWIVTMIGVLLFVGLKVLSLNIKRFSYPKTLSKKQTLFYYQYTRQTLELANLLIVITFGYLNYATIQIALEKQQNLGMFFMPTLLFLTTGLAISTFVNAQKLKRIS